MIHWYQGEQVSPWIVIPSSLPTATQFLRGNGGNVKIVGVNLQNTNHMKTDRLGVIPATVCFIIELLL